MSQVIKTTLQIDAEIEAARKKIGDLGKTLETLGASKGQKTSLETQLNEVLQLYDQLKNKAKGGKLFGEDAKQAEKLQTKINGLINQITAKTKSKGLFSEGLAEDQKKLKEIKKELAEASKLQKQADSKVEAARKKQEAIKKRINDATEERKQFGSKARSGAQRNETQSKLDQTKQQLRSQRGALSRAEAQQSKLDPSKGGEEAENFETLKTKIEECTKKIKELEEAKRKLEQVKVNDSRYDSLTKSIKADKAALKDAEKDYTDASNAANAAKESVEKLTEAQQNLSTQASQNTKAAMKQMTEATDELARANQELGDKVNRATADITEQDDRLKQVNNIKQRIDYFFTFQNVLNLTKRAIRSAYNEIKTLDKAMTETAVVTNYSVSDMWSNLPDYVKQANQLGSSIEDIVKARTLYYQQGLSTNEVDALSVQTLKMARIAGLDAAEATDRMTNAMRGFNMALTEANSQNVADVYSNLAAHTASNVDEISVAMTKVASLANNANMSFENTSAFLSQIIETTRESAETAGTALKTVIARFSEVKKLYSEGELGGQDEDGNAIDVNKVSSALRSAGIDLNEYLTGVKGLDDIFIELSKKWDSLDQVQQRYIATMAAGSRQQSRFIALMQDYNRMTELTTLANNSAGASEEQFQKTLESLDSTLNKLKNAWDEFIMGITNSDVIKGAISMLTELLNFVNKLTTLWGNIDTKNPISMLLKSLILIGGVSVLGKAWKKFSTSLTAWATNAGRQAGKAFREGFDGTSTEVTPTAGIKGGKFAKTKGKWVYTGTGEDNTPRLPDEKDLALTKAWKSETPEQFQASLEKSKALSSKDIELYTKGFKESEGDRKYFERVYGRKVYESEGRLNGIRKRYYGSHQLVDEKTGEVIPTDGNGNPINTGSKANGFSKGNALATVAAVAVALMVVQQVYNFVKKKIHEEDSRQNINTENSKAAQKAMQQSREQLSNFKNIKKEVTDITDSINRSTAGTLEWSENMVKLQEKMETIRNIMGDSFFNDPSNTKFINGVQTLTEEGWARYNRTLQQNMFTQQETVAASSASAAISKWNRDQQNKGGNLIAGASQETKDNLNLAAAGVAGGGVLAGAGIGASIGSAGGPIGAVIGLVVGLIAGAITYAVGNGIADSVGLNEEESNKLVDTYLRGNYELTEEGLNKLAEASGIASEKLKGLEDPSTEVAKAFREVVAANIEYRNQLKASGAQIGAALIGEMGLTLRSSESELFTEFFGHYNAVADKSFNDLARKKADELFGGSDKATDKFKYNEDLEKIYQQYATATGKTFNKFNTENPFGDDTKGAEIYEWYVANQAAQYLKNDAFLNYNNIKANSGTGGLKLAAGKTRKSLTLHEIEGLHEQNQLTEDTTIGTYYDFNQSGTSSTYEIKYKDGKLQRIITESNEATNYHNTRTEDISIDELKDTELDDIANKLGINELYQQASDKRSFLKNYMQIWDKNDVTRYFKGKDWGQGITGERDNALHDQLKSLTTSVQNQILGIYDEVWDSIEQNFDGDQKFKEFEIFSSINFNSFEDLINYRSQLLADETEANDDLVQYVNKLLDLGISMSRLSFSQVIDQLNSLNSIIEKINQQGSKTTFTESEYNKLLNSTGLKFSDFAFDGENYYYAGSGDINSVTDEVKAFRGLQANALLNRVESASETQSALQEFAFGGSLGTLVGEVGGQKKYFNANQLQSYTITANEDGVGGEITQMFQGQLGEALQKLVVKQDSGLSEIFENGQFDPAAAAALEDRLRLALERVFEDAQLDTEAKTHEGYSVMSWSNEYAEEYLNTKSEQEATAQMSVLNAKTAEYATLVQNATSQLTGLGDEAENVAKALIAGQDVAVNKLKEFNTTVADNLEVLKQENGQSKKSTEYAAAMSKVLLKARQIFGEGVDASWVENNLDSIEKLTKGGKEANATYRQLALSVYQNSEAFNALNEAGKNALNLAVDKLSNAEAGAVMSLKDMGMSADEMGKIGTDKLLQMAMAARMVGMEMKAIRDTNDKIINLEFLKIDFSSSFADSAKTSPQKPSLAVTSLDKYYNLTNAINESLRQREKLEREYDRILKRRTATYTQLHENTLQETASLRKEIDYQKQLNAGRLEQAQNLSNYNLVYKDGITTYGAIGANKYAWYNQERNQVEIDWNSIYGIHDSDLLSAVEDYVKKFEDYYKDAKETEKTIEDMEDELYEVEQRGKQQYIELEQRVLDAFIKLRQDEIDEYSAINDAINEANQEILNGIQESIDLERQIRDNTKTEEDIADKEARLAYLRMDTSGSNLLEIKSLEKELQDARENYEDQLIDQTIDKINKDNEKAQELREKQIRLMEQQLEYDKQQGAFWDDVYKTIQESLTDGGALKPGSVLEKMLKQTDAFKGMSTFAQKDWMEELAKSYAEAMLGKENYMLREAKEVGQVEAENTLEGRGYTWDGSNWVDNNGAIYDMHWDARHQKYTATAIKTQQVTVPAPPPQYVKKDDDGDEQQNWTLEEAQKYIEEHGLDRDYRQYKHGGGGNELNYLTAKGIIKKFATGGLANFTGPAWLDGSQSHPELVLNARDTENFIQLKNVLAQLLGQESGAQGSTGDNYYDIDIQAEIGSDYDVDQLADRIKQQIVDDSAYRNVQSINLLR